MTILKDFAPKDPTHNSIGIPDPTDDTPGFNNCGIEKRNYWLKNSQDLAHFNWHTTHMKAGVEQLVNQLGSKGLWVAINWESDHHLTSFLKKLHFQISLAQDIDGGMYDLSGSERVPWFVYSDYHVVHGLSLQFGVDIRPTWLTLWDWQPTNNWCRARIQESLEDETPLEKTLEKIFGGVKVDIRTKIDPVPRRSLSHVDERC